MNIAPTITQVFGVELWHLPSLFYTYCVYIHSLLTNGERSCWCWRWFLCSLLSTFFSFRTVKVSCWPKRNTLNYWKFHVFILICVSTGVSDTKTVIQTPGHIVKRPEESVDREINCQHNIPNHDYILWYKQEENKSLKYLGFLNRKYETVESDLSGKIHITGDGNEKSELTIYNLFLNDSGVYFCAARQHGAAESQPANTKYSS